jgi:hypothetical protein
VTAARKVIEHTFETVDKKTAETEFFLRMMVVRTSETFSFDYFFSAFVSAARTTTLALQQFKRLPGFDAWYGPHRERLKREPLAKFFLDTRNDHVHGGPYPVTSSMHHLGKSQYYFDRGANAPQRSERDVVSMSRDFFVMLLEVVHDCYVELGVHIDPQQYFTREHFETVGRTIDDAEVEIWGWVCTGLIDEGLEEDDRWYELRGHAGECKINHLFYAYLGMPTPQPVLPEHIIDFDFAPEDRGWIHVPAGFDSVEDYERHRLQRRTSESRTPI